MKNEVTCAGQIFMLMTIFDKSFIHSITAEEAVVFDQHFMSNLTPLFFVEVLADLEKANLQHPEDRVKLVQTLAGKTPSFHSYPNVHHSQIVLNELMGRPTEIRGVPIVGGGRRVQSKEGLGTVFEPSPEMKAAQRWHNGEFGDEEYAVARAWREQLRRAPDHFDQTVQGSGSRFSFRDLSAVKATADSMVHRDGWRLPMLKQMLEVFDVPSQNRPEIIERWKAEGGPPLRKFLPFATHVLTVDLFRILGMSSGHIDPDKTSNYADIAYFYYLPFCQIFVSCDKLHRRCASLFLTQKQQFVWGHDLRPHLSQLVEQYLADPQLEDVGLIGLAGKKIFDGDSFIGALQRSFRSGQVRIAGSGTPKLSKESERQLVERLKAAAEAPPPDTGVDLEQEDQMMTIKRSLRMKLGRFPLMPKGVKPDH